MVFSCGERGPGLLKGPFHPAWGGFLLLKGFG